MNLFLDKLRENLPLFTIKFMDNDKLGTVKKDYG